MHETLTGIVEDLRSVSAEVDRLASEYEPEAWRRRPAEASWSAAECIAHLNLTSKRFVGLFDEAIARGREANGRMPGRLRMDPVGWLVLRAVRPSAPVRVKTRAAFEPVGAGERDAIVAEFERLQGEQIERIRASDGLPIGRVRIASPFARGVKYSMYSAFLILAAHQRRHVGQAERALLAAEGVR